MASGEEAATGEPFTARVVVVIPRGGPEPVYNLEVRHAHVYHVTTAGLLVHNSCDTLGKAAKAGRPNLNSNNAVSRFGVYELTVNRALYKIGKADLNRVTRSSGLPTRLHQQVRRLTKIFGKGNVTGRVVKDLGETTTAAAKAAEHARIAESLTKTGFVPLGNWKSFRP